MNISLQPPDTGGTEQTGGVTKEQTQAHIKELKGEIQEKTEQVQNLNHEIHYMNKDIGMMSMVGGFAPAEIKELEEKVDTLKSARNNLEKIIPALKSQLEAIDPEFAAQQQGIRDAKTERTTKLQGDSMVSHAAAAGGGTQASGGANAAAAASSDPTPPASITDQLNQIQTAATELKANPFFEGVGAACGIFVAMIKANMQQGLAAIEETSFEVKFITSFTSQIEQLAKLTKEEGELQAESKRAQGITQIVGGVMQGVVGMAPKAYMPEGAKSAFSSALSGVSQGATSMIDANYTVQTTTIDALKVQVQNLMQLMEQAIQTAKSNADKLNDNGKNIVQSLEQLLQQMQQAFNTLSAQRQ